MSAAATAAGYLYARARLSERGSTGKWTQSARITRRSLSPRDAGSPRAPRGRMNRNRSKRLARRESSIANGAPTFCHRLHELLPA